MHYKALGFLLAALTSGLPLAAQAPIIENEKAAPVAEVGKFPEPKTLFLKKPEETIKADVADLIVIKPNTNASKVFWIVPRNAANKHIRRVPSEKLKDSREIIFCVAKPGKYEIFAVAIDGNDILDPVSFLIEIAGGVGPTPPAPDDEPDFPDGKYKLASITYRALASTLTLDDGVKSICRQISTNYVGVAAQIAAGTIANPEAALKAIIAANEKTLADARADRATWSKSSEIVQKEMVALYNAKKLATLGDFATAFREIAEGFKAIGDKK